MTRPFIVLLLLAAAVACAAFEEPVSSEGAQKQTTSGGNLVADALRYAARTDAALVISSDLREITCPGDAPAEELVSLAAVKSDRVYSLNLTGSVIKQALAKSLFLYPRANPAFMHVSGLRVTMKDGFLVRAEIRDRDGAFEPLADGVIYSVAMSQSLAEGVLGFWKLWDAEDATDEDLTMGDVIPMYLAEQSLADPFEQRLITEE